MIKIFSFLLFLFAIVVRTELTLERIDAITDLSAIAKNFFSEEPNLKYEEPNANTMNAFTWSISEMWDEKESALYVLTRLAKLVDEKDSNGELTAPARVIRSFAEKSEARKVYFTTAESSSAAMVMSSSSSYDAEIKEDEEIEKLFMTGNDEEAVIKVDQMIGKRWINTDKAIEDIETAAKDGSFNLMAALIKQGSNHKTLKFMAPELKAGLIIKLLSLPNAQIQPTTAKWLFTMDTYREEQLKLVKTIEKALKKRAAMGQEKTMMQRTRNNLLEVFGEVETIESRKKNAELKSDYFNGIASIDVDSFSKSFYKSSKSQKKTTKNSKQQKLEKAANANAKVNKEQETKTTENDKKDKVKGQQETVQAEAENDKKRDQERNYFEEREEREREIEKVLYETNDDPLYDNDGEYDDNEKKRDRIARIVVISLVGAIVGLSVAVYVYLRARRARRNRTMLVVTEALETVA